MQLYAGHFILAGNVLCKGDTLLEQMEFCHFSTRGDECAPPAKIILEGQNISASPGTGKGEDGLCDCKFRLGKRICAGGRSNNK